MLACRNKFFYTHVEMLGKLRVLVVVLFGLAAVVAPGCISVRILADVPNSLIISEIKINNDSAGYNEFVELYNGSGKDIELSNYHLIYYNVTSPGASDQPTAAALPSGILSAGNYLVLAQNTAQIPNSVKLPLSSLKDTSGALIVADANGNVTDQLAWSNSKTGLPAGAVIIPASNQSLQRPQDAAGVPQVNAGWITGASNPVSSVLASDPAAAATISNNGLGAPEITELLPNPASPKTDAADEFIELYNPNDQPFDLSGFTLLTGTTSTHKYTFPKGIILKGFSYTAFYSAQTKADLSNTGGQARLLDPGGQTVSSSSVYSKAPDGVAWALGDDGWQWTTTPTPGAANNISVPEQTVSSSTSKTTKTSTKTTTKATTKKTTTKKTTTKKPKSTKTKKSGSGSAASDGAKDVSNVVPASSSIHPYILAGIGGLALLYAGYEYREDIANKFHQFKENRSIGRKARQKPEGRRSY